MTDEDVWDFSLDVKPKRFKVNGPDVFEAHAILPMPVMRKLVKFSTSMAEIVEADEKFEKFLDVFDLILTPESAKRFRQRVESVEEPVDLQQQLMPILYRLMESWGLRPTQPSSGSSNTPDGTGTPSTGGAHPGQSTPTPSVLTGS